MLFDLLNGALALSPHHSSDQMLPSEYQSFWFAPSDFDAEPPLVVTRVRSPGMMVNLLLVMLRAFRVVAEG